LKILIIPASKNVYIMPQMYNLIVEYFRPKLITYSFYNSQKDLLTIEKRYVFTVYRLSNGNGSCDSFFRVLKMRRIHRSTIIRPG
jgi:hypothetical protein